jgi:hypothetical protein
LHRAFYEDDSHTCLFVVKLPTRCFVARVLILGSGEEDRGDEAIRMALTALQPLAGQLGFGGFMGYCSGYAAKKIGKVTKDWLFLYAVAFDWKLDVDYRLSKHVNGPNNAA